MKRFLALLLTLLLVFSLAACGSAPAEQGEPEQAAENQTAPEVRPVEQVIEESVAEDGWAALEEQGQVATEKGEEVASLIIPADYVGEDTTQESLDAEAGEYYVSATLNADGTVTYKVTKEQHSQMLNQIVWTFEELVNEQLVNWGSSFTSVTHSDDMTHFEAITSSATEDDMSFGDSVVIDLFFAYGEMYGIYAGMPGQTMTIDIYNENGELISSMKSAE